MSSDQLSNLNQELSTLSSEQQAVIQAALDAGQEHLFADWEAPGTSTAEKQAFLDQLGRVNASYPGGLLAYSTNARKLLAEAAEGSNPFEGFTPEQPDCVDISKFNAEFDRYEALGADNFAHLGIVLVAGGMGERLGYDGIKIDIPVEITTTTPYLKHFCRSIAAIQARSTGEGKVPFVIMTSGQTHASTVKSFEENNYFGLAADQVHILRQELVPAVSDNDARIAKSGTYGIQLKPHGHGDVHMLLHTSGLATRLQAQGITHLAFIQDTNGQVFNALPAALGVSIEREFDFNSLAVNRVPKEAVGGLAKLVGPNRSLTLNIEYNQLDPLLRDTINPEGDVANAEGFSVFPGNINVLMVKVESYVRVLKDCGGIIAEFVNPKYADESKTSFKKPTRLETMMQDFPKNYESDEKVGVTIFDRKWCFSPMKNNIVDAAGKAAANSPPESGATAESDFYKGGRTKLELAGMKVETADEINIAGIPFTPGPYVLLSPGFGMTVAEIRSKISGGSLAGNATLIVDGSDVKLENVTVTPGSALIVKACEGASVTVKDMVVDNSGFKLVEMSDAELVDESIPQYLRIRGYTIEAVEPQVLSFDEAGEYTVGG